MSSASTIILITGANSGIGYAASKVIARANKSYHVIMASRSLENGKQALSEVKAADGIKGSLSTIQLDVTEEKSVKTAAAEVEKQFGRLDVLVNNAGAGGLGMDDVDKRFDMVLKTNVIGPALVSDVFRPLLFKSRDPRSIYISSGLGSFARSTDPDEPYYRFDADAYRTSKAALNMMALQEYIKYEAKGLKVWVMCPGLVESNLRGKSEKARTLGGAAGDPEVSGATMLSIIEGKRDSDVGKFVHKDGVYAW